MIETENKTEAYFINAANSTVSDSPFKVSGEEEEFKAVPHHNPLPPASIDPSIDKWFFLSGQPNL